MESAAHRGSVGGRRGGENSGWAVLPLAPLEGCDVDFLGGYKATIGLRCRGANRTLYQEIFISKQGSCRERAELGTGCRPRITGELDTLKRSNHISQYRSIRKVNNNCNGYQLSSIDCEPSCRPVITLTSESHHKSYVSKFKLTFFLLPHKTCPQPCMNGTIMYSVTPRLVA